MNPFQRELRQVLGAARGVQNLGGDHAQANIRPSLARTISQNHLSVRTGPAGAMTFSMPGQRGVGLAVVGGRGDSTQYMGDFLRRGAQAMRDLSQTRSGQTMIQGLNAYSRRNQRQLHSEPAMLIAPVQEGAHGVVGSSAAPRHMAGARGGTLVNWDHLDQAHPAWGDRTNNAVLIGHEGVHALRRTQGQNFNSNGLVAPAAQAQRMEELQTSGLASTPTPINENRLRGELGVRPRWNYGGLTPARGFFGRLRDNVATRALYAGGNWLRGFTGW